MQHLIRHWKTQAAILTAFGHCHAVRRISAARLEIQRMICHGLPPAEALIAATRTVRSGPDLAVLQLGAPVAGQLLANPALAGQFTWPDRPAGPRPADMAGWVQASRDHA